MSLDITIRTLRPVRLLSDMVQFVPDVQSNFANLQQRLGIWTPTVTGSGGNVGQIYSAQTARYVRNGRLIWCRFDLQLSTLGTVTGGVQISGFPYAPTETIGFMLGIWQNLTTAVLGVPARMNAGSVVAALDKLTAATTSSSAAQLAQADLSNTTRLAGTCLYYTQ